MKKGHNRAGGIAADQLAAVIQRIEKLEEEKRAIGDDIKEVYAEAKGNGFDTKTIRTIIKLRKLDASEREEQEALLDIYMAALGMLGDTPLGEAAIRRLSKRAEPEEDDDEPGETGTPEDNAENATEEAAGPTIDEARDMGKEAAESGAPVTDNPFPARDPRRAAWDEAWCRHMGSDGMDLPDAWRRPSKKKKPDDADEDKAA